MKVAINTLKHIFKTTVTVNPQDNNMQKKAYKIKMTYSFVQNSVKWVLQRTLLELLIVHMD